MEGGEYEEGWWRKTQNESVSVEQAVNIGGEFSSMSEMKQTEDLVSVYN